MKVRRGQSLLSILRRSWRLHVWQSFRPAAHNPSIRELRSMVGRIPDCFRSWSSAIGMINLRQIRAVLRRRADPGGRSIDLTLESGPTPFPLSVFFGTNQKKSECSWRYFTSSCVEHVGILEKPRNSRAGHLRTAPPGERGSPGLYSSVPAECAIRVWPHCQPKSCEKDRPSFGD